MDLNLLYRDFIMNDRELMFHSVPGTVPSFHDDEGNMYCAVPVFQHSDSDLGRDPLSTNHRLTNTADLPMFGTLVVKGSSPDHIKVLIPDTFGPTVHADSPVVLQHVVGLSLGPAVDLSSSLPPPDLDRALCNNSMLPTLIRRPDPAEMAEYQIHQVPGVRPVDTSKYDTSSPTLTHDLPVWFASELNGNDHLERIHNFTEGRGYSFYDCLRQFGLEWFGRRSFFDQRDTTGQASWMDLALARKTGQELHNDYVLTSSPAFGNLRKFFRAAIRDLVHAYIDYPRPQVDTCGAFSVCGPSRTSPVDQVEDVPVVESLSPLILSSATPPLPVVETPVRSLTPNNRSLSFLQTGPGEHAHLHVPQSRGAVSSVSIASTELLYYVEPLPLDQFILHDTQTVRDWPDNARN